jgi:hypothetical protein
MNKHVFPLLSSYNRTSWYYVWVKGRAEFHLIRYGPMRNINRSGYNRTRVIEMPYRILYQMRDLKIVTF